MASQADRQLPGISKTANEEFLDALIRHQVFILRLSGGLRNQTLEFLNADEKQLAALIRAQLEDAGQLLTPRILRQIDVLIEDSVECDIR